MGAAECGFTIGWPLWTMIESTRVAWASLCHLRKRVHQSRYRAADQ